MNQHRHHRCTKTECKLLSISKGSKEMGSTLWVLVEDKFFKVKQIVAISVVSPDYFRCLRLADGHPQALLHQYQLLVGRASDQFRMNFDKDTRSSLQKLLSFRYKKKRMANRTPNFEGGIVKWWRPCNHERKLFIGPELGRYGWKTVGKLCNLVFFF